MQTVTEREHAYIVLHLFQSNVNELSLIKRKKMVNELRYLMHAVHSNVCSTCTHRWRCMTRPVNRSATTVATGNAVSTVRRRRSGSQEKKNSRWIQHGCVQFSMHEQWSCSCHVMSCHAATVPTLPYEARRTWWVGSGDGVVWCRIAPYLPSCSVAPATLSLSLVFQWLLLFRTLLDLTLQHLQYTIIILSD